MKGADPREVGPLLPHSVIRPENLLGDLLAALNLLGGSSCRFQSRQGSR
jgi:hypothetical protein